MRILAKFPYVNGDLFKDSLRIPSFNAAMRNALLETCRFDWSNISPAIFGALFQSVMEPAERRAQGAHYTTEKNILKLIEPLFMDDLREEFTRLKARKDSRRLAETRRFQEKLGGMKFFDPACGCGNFLIIAYRELRELEMEVIRELRAAEAQRELDVAELSRITVDQFYGIELGEFPARIAETALWMMDHIMNNRLSLEFGQTYTRIPLTTSPHVLCADALEDDWAALLPPEDCSFVFGNPPFVGAKFQTGAQRLQARRVADLGKSGGTLDYVTAWFIRAGEYLQKSATRIGFVATNSVTQGEQAAQLWPLLFERCRLEISFAHRTFAWGSDARGVAHVHVVIIGLDAREAARAEKRLFSYPDINGETVESRHAALSPYLFDAGGLADPHLTVREESRSINGLPQLLSGVATHRRWELTFSMPTNAPLFLTEEPVAEKFFHPYVGAREYMRGGERWILYSSRCRSRRTQGNAHESSSGCAPFRMFRAKSKRKSTLKIADYPAQYNVEVIPTTPLSGYPRSTSSERRDYVPIAWLEPPVIPSNKIRILPNADLQQFALLTSAMHMAWVGHIGGRLKSDFVFGIGVIYNTFPTPPGDADLPKLEPLAQAVLDARAAHPDATLADLYDPDLMPPDLRRVHQALDRAVDRLYRRTGFASERERVEHLFALYEKMRAPLGSAGAEKTETAEEKVKVNDPHVVALLYRVDHGKSVSYQDAEPLLLDEPAFRLEVKDGQARFELKEHYATQEDALKSVEDYIQNWEFDASLESGPGSFRLKFQKAEIVDRNPTPDVIDLSYSFL